MINESRAKKAFFGSMNHSLNNFRNGKSKLITAAIGKREVADGYKIPEKRHVTKTILLCTRGMKTFSQLDRKLISH